MDRPGEPAFSSLDGQYYGMSIRAWLTGQAIASGRVIGHESMPNESTAQWAARSAVAIADAVLAELAK